MHPVIISNKIQLAVLDVFFLSYTCPLNRNDLLAFLKLNNKTSVIPSVDSF